MTDQANSTKDAKNDPLYRLVDQAEGRMHRTGVKPSPTVEIVVPSDEEIARRVREKKGTDATAPTLYADFDPEPLADRMSIHFSVHKEGRTTLWATIELENGYGATPSIHYSGYIEGENRKIKADSMFYLINGDRKEEAARQLVNLVRPKGCRIHGNVMKLVRSCVDQLV